MEDYQTLIGEHDEIDRLALDLLHMVSGLPDAGAAIDVRARLSLCLEEHLDREDAFIYERALATRDMEYPRAVSAFNQKFAALRTDWADYLRGWDSECIAADWAGFTQETIAMTTRLRERIAEENSILYPLALQKGHIRLRRAA